MLQNKAEEDEKKMMQLEGDLKAARTAAEDADASYEEISKKLVQCEADLERAEERAETGQLFSSILLIVQFFSLSFCIVFQNRGDAYHGAGGGAEGGGQQLEVPRG